MSLQVSKRVQRVKPSPTLAVTQMAAELRAAGEDVIGLGAGEPDFDTPEHIREAGIAAIRDGKTRYTAVDGTVELKDAIIEKFRRDNNLEYTREQIMVSSGAKQTCFNLAAAVLDPGDRALVVAPYWVSYPDMILLADGEPAVVETGPEQGYKLTPAQLDEALTDDTRLMFLNSPSNPSGAAYSRAELEALGEVLDRYPNLVIGTDDMYEHIYWADEPFCSLLTACPQLSDRVVTINGVSKAYAMTGWRIGYCGAPKSLVAAMRKIQGQSTSNPCSISQAASVVALNADQGCVADMVRAFRERHDFIVGALNDMPGISCLQGAGTFYAFPDCREAIAALGLDDDTAFSQHLLKQAGVAVVPGSAFGTPGHVRLSFACGLDTLKDAAGRIRQALAGQ